MDLIDVEFPPGDSGDRNKDRKLRQVMKVPQPPSNMKPERMPKAWQMTRGPEEVHNTFLHKQYGIVVRLPD